MIRADFGGSDKAVQEALLAKKATILGAVKVKMQQLDLQLQQKIQGDKLQGQVLQHRTGKLAASIRTVDVVTKGDIVEGGVEGAGGVAFYGRFQNYGTDREYEIVPKNKLALAFFPQGGPVPINKAAARGILLGFRSRRASTRAAAATNFGNLGGVVVKKVMHPPITERNFMESTAEEFRQQYVEGIQAAVIEGAKGGKA